MPRAPRPQFAGAEYHLFARGIRRSVIFIDDVDRAIFLGMVADVVVKLGWKCRAYCFMTNHFHLVVTTPEPNVSVGMRWLLGRYGQWFNRRHGFEGHVFERRYRHKLIDSDAYRLVVTRYVFRNPVEAGVCARPEDWPWSSYSATIELVERPVFLEPGWVVAQFGCGRRALRRLQEFVMAEPAGTRPDPPRPVEPAGSDPGVLRGRGRSGRSEVWVLPSAHGRVPPLRE